jgi:hypothetical protein
LQIYDTETIKKDEAAWKTALTACIAYLILSKFDNHQSDMMHRLVQLKDVKLLPSFHQILTKFTTKEVIAFPFEFQVHIYIHIYIHSYIHTFIHSYIHTYIHTYIYMASSCLIQQQQLSAPL